MSGDQAAQFRRSVGKPVPVLFGDGFEDPHYATDECVGVEFSRRGMAQTSVFGEFRYEPATNFVAVAINCLEEKLRRGSVR